LIDSSFLSIWKSSEDPPNLIASLVYGTNVLALAGKLAMSNGCDLIQTGRELLILVGKDSLDFWCSTIGSTKKASMKESDCLGGTARSSAPLHACQRIIEQKAGLRR
jgi:hypothetical protein